MARDYAYIVLMCLVPEGKKIVFFLLFAQSSICNGLFIL
ncbi:protein of unknown function [Xenorhabdus bovienii]|uniref:Uncharacterized protein n=2 Tax=Xenorhabdus bovienii TaxID=40576 RepID=A0A0B6X967_XENBV|nr:hypothetical protein XBKB1_1510029 [Xenorhabdus bovienii str. kraussei Becker Underwood]CDM90125.1 protein of unknown function [Xenorhabdus bovienii]